MACNWVERTEGCKPGQKETRNRSARRYAATGEIHQNARISPGERVTPAKRQVATSVMHLICRGRTRKQLLGHGGIIEPSIDFRIQEPDYEMYENGPSTPLSTNRHQHRHHHHHHHHHRIANGPSDHPSYQNTAYTGSDAEQDGPTLSSAPSSAYYSDLSSNSANQQIPVQTTTNLSSNLPLEPPAYRLAAINEGSGQSDYI